MSIESQPAPAGHPSGHGHDADGVAVALAAMTRAGLRRMPSRVLILEQLARAQGHLSAAEIHRNRGPEYAQVHLGTVHRGLETLQRAGLVHVIDDHGRQLFGLSLPPHLHAVCTSCGQVSEVSAEGLGPAIARLADTAGFLVDPDGVTLRGLCANCRAR
jgi:Fur family ferric uptake transcriptional regulator